MQKKLFIGMALALSWVIALAGIFSYQAAKSSSLRQVDAQLESSWGLVEDATKGASDAELAMLLSDLGQPGVLRITLIDQDGTVVAESDGTAPAENHSGREEVVEALTGDHGAAQRFSATEQRQMRYYAKRLGDGRVLRVAAPMLYLRSFQRDVMVNILISVLVALLLSLAITYLFARGISRPLTRWAGWAEAVADSPQSPPQPPSENPTQLSEPIRKLVDTLSASVLKLSHQTSELDAILSGMCSGLIAIGRDGHVALMNRTAKEWFGVLELQPGASLVATTQQPSLAALLQGQDEVELSLPSRSVRATFMQSQGSASDLLGLIWLEDLSEKRSVEIQRREFAANVSHELKTPLMAIQGAADSLRADQAPEEKEKLIAMIEREVAWLAALMGDMLTLSRVESMYQDPDVECLDLSEVVADVLRAQSAAAKAKKVTLTQSVPDLCVTANYGRMRQLIGNLVDNAIKYNVEGGAVAVSARAEGNQLRLTVSDTGIGIPREKQPRVFERFYRADESHARASLGTGLGLSIVKHIVRLYGGKIALTSGEGGTKFDLTLPIAAGEGSEHT